MIKDIELISPASCLSKAFGDEMMFVLLARDAAAPAAIKAWIAERVRLGLNKPEDLQMLEAEQCYLYMEAQRPSIQERKSK